MGELAASLAHEIKQPIVGAVIAAQTAFAGSLVTLPTSRSIEGRLDNGRGVTRAGGIIDRVSSHYRRGTLERELVDVNEIIREIKGSARNKEQAGQCPKTIKPPQDRRLQVGKALFYVNAGELF